MGLHPAITDLMGGHIEAVTYSAAEVAPQVQDKLLRMFAVTSSERMDNFPDVPTAMEQGYDLDLGTWRGWRCQWYTHGSQIKTGKSHKGIGQ